VIALLRGRVAAATLGQVVLDVAGVGYQVRIPPGTPVGAVGAEVTVHTHLAVREDAMTLYGFADVAGRDLFETLLSVTGVGPKLALAAIGSLGADGLRRAVVTEDVAALTVIPGVGKKGAQRMVLELREKLGGTGEAVPGTAGVGPLDARSEVREALASLGYAPAEIAKTLDALPSDAASPEELLRDALRSLGKR
jgi:holliday junction DNA helicase RuvA